MWKLLESAIALHNGGRMEQASALYKKFIAVDPANMDALQLHGMALLRRGYVVDGYLWVSRAYRIVMRDVFLKVNGNASETMRHLIDNHKPIIKNYTNAFIELVGDAARMIAADRPDAALRALDLALDARSVVPEPSCYVFYRDPDCRDLTQAANAPVRDHPAWRRLAALYSWFGLDRHALTVLQGLAAAGPLAAAEQRLLGLSLARTAQWESARAALEPADPRLLDREVVEALIDCYAHLHDPEAGERLLRRQIELGARGLTAAEALYRCLADAGRLEEAEDAVIALGRRADADGDVRAYAALVHIQRGELAAAAAMIDAGASQGARQDLWRLAQGNLAFRQGDWSKAADAFAEADKSERYAGAHLPYIGLSIMDSSIGMLASAYRRFQAKGARDLASYAAWRAQPGATAPAYPLALETLPTDDQWAPIDAWGSVRARLISPPAAIPLARPQGISAHHWRSLSAINVMHSACRRFGAGNGDHDPRFPDAYNTGGVHHAQARDGIVVHSSILQVFTFSKYGALLGDINRFFDFTIHCKAKQTFEDLDLAIPDDFYEIDESCVWLDCFHRGHIYGQYLELLPKVKFLLENPDFDDKAVIYPEKNDLLRRFLIDLGIEERRLIPLALDSACRVADLHFFLQRPGFVEPETLTWFHRRIRRIIDSRRFPPSPKIVYISRARSPHRKVLNEAAIAALIEPLGGRLVFIEDYGYDELLALFSTCELLIFGSGAALNNMVFLKEGAAVIDIVGRYYYETPSWIIANTLNLKHHVYYERRVMENDHIHLDIPAFSAFLDNTLRQIGV